MTTATERPPKSGARAAALLVALVAFDALTKVTALLVLPTREPVHDGALFQLVLRVNKTGVGSFGRLLLHGRQIQTMLPASFAYIALSTAMVVVRRRELRSWLEVAVCAGVFFAVFAVGQALLPHLLHWPAGVALLLMRLSLASLWITVWALVSSRWFKLGLLFFAASATGNLLSLLLPPSAVVDFVYSAPVSHVFGLGVFNVADALFLLGEMLLVLAALRWFVLRMIRLRRGTSAVPMGLTLREQRSVGRQR